jgi:hypothetical protein
MRVPDVSTMRMASPGWTATARCWRTWSATGAGPCRRSPTTGAPSSAWRSSSSRTAASSPADARVSRACGASSSRCIRSPRPAPAIRKPRPACATAWRCSRARCSTRARLHRCGAGRVRGALPCLLLAPAPAPPRWPTGAGLGGENAAPERPARASAFRRHGDRLPRRQPPDVALHRAGRRGRGLRRGAPPATQRRARRPAAAPLPGMGLPFQQLQAGLGQRLRGPASERRRRGSIACWQSHAALAKQLKRLLDILKPQDKVRLRYQEEGSELDLDVACAR